MNKVAIYPGTFDPITYGHIDVIKKSLKLFDKIVVGVSDVNNKDYLFDSNERIEIIKKALRYKPNYICIVPENRKEITTEGGLNLKDNYKKLKEIISKFKKSNIRTSLFINPNLNDIKLSKKLNVDCVEIHTGKLANYVKSHKNFSSELNRIRNCSKLASKLNIEVHAGHGLDYKTTKILTNINEIEEFNIGHFIIGESIFYGLPKVIKDFKKIIKN